MKTHNPIIIIQFLVLKLKTHTSKYCIYLLKTHTSKYCICLLAYLLVVKLKARKTIFLPIDDESMKESNQTFKFIYLLLCFLSSHEGSKFEHLASLDIATTKGSAIHHLTSPQPWRHPGIPATIQLPAQACIFPKT